MTRHRNLMLAFEGMEVPGWLAQTLQTDPPEGITLFRKLNMESPEQVASLIGDLQRLNSAEHPLLIAVDQETGQLTGLTGSTPFPGNMALGAAGDPDLTRSVAAATGEELAAVGINLNYAPVADVASRPGNPSLGVRAFGDDATLVASHVAAAVEGYRSAGILTTLKHFPGKGEAVVDPHYELPRMDLHRERLDSVELPPFRSGITAGADLVMTGHYAVPALTGSETAPVSMSARAIDGFLRAEVGFRGLVITDALDMGALDQGEGQIDDIVAALTGGTDLLLVMPDPELRTRVAHAMQRSNDGAVPTEQLSRSRARIDEVRSRLRIRQAEPDRVGSHLELAREVARRSITLVRDDAGVLPLEPRSSILVLEPTPANVTPADTTSAYPASLGAELSKRFANTETIVYPHALEGDGISDLIRAAVRHDTVVIGTVNAAGRQASLVTDLVAAHDRVVTVSLREPQDLAAYPTASTHIAAYTGHTPAMSAVADAMLGNAQFYGRLPVTIPGLYPRGHRS